MKGTVLLFENCIPVHFRVCTSQKHHRCAGFPRARSLGDVGLKKHCAWSLWGAREVPGLLFPREQAAIAKVTVNLLKI